MTPPAASRPMKPFEVLEDCAITTADPVTGAQLTKAFRKGRHTPKSEVEEMLLDSLVASGHAKAPGAEEDQA